MPNFKFEGRDGSGHLLKGERLAESPEQLSQLLFNEGITPITISLAIEKMSAWHKIKIFFEPKRMSTTDLALFTRQMYTLNKAGVPISNAVRHLSKTAHSLKMSQVLLSISKKLEAGQNLDAAMESYPDFFSPLIIAMIKVGQTTGQLDNAFLRLTEYLELEGSTIKRIKTAIRYPVFVFISILIGLVIINIFVVPAFSKMFFQANIPLPLATRLLIGSSNFFVHYWFLILTAVLLAAFSTYRYIKTPKGRYEWDKFQLKIPIIGFLLQRMSLLRFSETFAIIVNSGIPVNEGLSLVAQSITNHYARAEVLNMKEAVQRGSSLFQAASGSKLFTGLELQMLSISEQTGELGAMLTEITHYYQREIDYDLKHLTDMIEPILLSIIAFMVLFLALAVYMPIWGMVQLAHRG